MRRAGCAAREDCCWSCGRRPSEAPGAAAQERDPLEPKRPRGIGGRCSCGAASCSSEGAAPAALLPALRRALLLRRRFLLFGGRCSCGAASCSSEGAAPAALLLLFGGRCSCGAALEAGPPQPCAGATLSNPKQRRVMGVFGSLETLQLRRRKRIAAPRVTSVETNAEPPHPLRRRAMREGVRHHGATRLPL